MVLQNIIALYRRKYISNQFRSIFALVNLVLTLQSSAIQPQKWKNKPICRRISTFFYEKNIQVFEIGNKS